MSVGIILQSVSTVNVQAIRGEEFEVVYVFYDDDGSLEDLSGVSFSGSMIINRKKRSFTGSELVFTQGESKITLTMSRVEQLKIPTGRHNFSIQQTKSGNIRTRIKGTINFVNANS